MAYETFRKRGKKSKLHPGNDPGSHDRSPTTMYGAADLSGGRPDSSRRLTNSYGKTAGKRAEYKPEVGERSRTAGRMFKAAKDGVSRYNGY